MKTNLLKLVVIAAVLIVSAVGVLAAVPKAQEFKGDIIDGMCLAGHKDDLKTFIDSHSKQCVLADGCKTSGMNLYTTDGSIVKFDKESGDKIVRFLEKTESKLKVDVTATKNLDGTYRLESIKNL
jgi:hypothetical protein